MENRDTMVVIGYGKDQLVLTSVMTESEIVQDGENRRWALWTKRRGRLVITPDSSKAMDFEKASSRQTVGSIFFLRRFLYHRCMA